MVFIGMQIPSIALISSSISYGGSTFHPITLTVNLQLALIFVNAIATAITLSSLYLFLPENLAAFKSNGYFPDKQFPDKQNKKNESASDLEIGNLVAETDEALSQLGATIQHLADYDTLTGLPNRQSFKDSLQQAVNRTATGQFALIVLDLDSLKNTNNTLGGETGDLLLIRIALRLTAHLSDLDTIARFGGDEFIILRNDLSDRNSSTALAQKLLSIFAEPFVFDGKEVYCAARIAIVTYPTDGKTVEQLLQNADTAIYRAKQQSPNTYQFYCPITSSELRRSLTIKENLRYALVRNELFIEYQPRIEIATGRLASLEALLRWDSPELGLVSPVEFIPIAEETNMILSLGEWVLRHACLQNKRWQQQGIAPPKISVNLSTCQLRVNPLETIDRILNETGLECTYLELEITESQLVEDIEQAVSLLSQLKQRGISLALDDFGTGYSSLRYLQKLPIDTIKIDRSFVTNLASGAGDAAIVKAIVALAQSLEINITAEGVETAEQFSYLRDLGCNEVQGYYFSKPLSPQMLAEFLVNHNSQLATKIVPT